ncbi:endonuclease [Pseudoduganella rivuli]|uniref:endonuclease n=1 Tax=Pseudoduganella rivuli TaxID=2666085 RepID=UPI003530EDEB
MGLLVRSDPALSFSYPSHIDRASLDALPQQPGIYVFRDADGVAVYVGKSVNIRHRVLSHLRTPEEMQMLARTARVDFERTGGEIGALLREAQLIKQWQPVFNQKLRRTREMCGYLVPDDGVTLQLVFGRERDFAATDNLFGLFGSRQAAQEALRDLVQLHGLCPALLGLEKISRGRACFAHQIGRCRGACAGHETHDLHRLRLLEALIAWQVARWPYDGAIGIVEESDGLRQVHLVDRWCYLGVKPKGRRRKLARGEFDIDVYQILRRPLLAGDLVIERYMPL